MDKFCEIEINDDDLFRSYSASMIPHEGKENKNGPSMEAYSMPYIASNAKNLVDLEGSL